MMRFNSPRFWLSRNAITNENDKNKQVMAYQFKDICNLSNAWKLTWNTFKSFIDIMKIPRESLLYKESFYMLNKVKLSKPYLVSNMKQLFSNFPINMISLLAENLASASMGFDNFKIPEGTRLCDSKLSSVCQTFENSIKASGNNFKKNRIDGLVKDDHKKSVLCDGVDYLSKSATAYPRIIRNSFSMFDNLTAIGTDNENRGLRLNQSLEDFMSILKDVPVIKIYPSIRYRTIILNQAGIPAKILYVIYSSIYI